MALTQNSTILISDISSALSGKQDKLAYVPVKSVNGTSADANGEITISTGGGTATAIANCAAWSALYNGSAPWRWGKGTFTQGSVYSDNLYFTKWKAPSGGTWGIFTLNNISGSITGRTVSGGTTIEMKSNSFAIKTA